MTSAEAWFLKSEAALRGWANAGDAAANYNNGILIHSPNTVWMVAPT